MTRIGLLLTILLLASAAPAYAAFVEVARFDIPSGGVSVAVSPAGDAIYASEASGGGAGGAIQRFTAEGTQAAVWNPTGDPFGIIVEATGNLLLANGSRNQVVRYSPAGAELGTIGSEGTGAGKFKTPEDVAIGPNGDIFVTDNGNNRVERFSANGTFVSQIKDAAQPGPNGFPVLTFLSVDAAGNVYATDGGNQTIRKFDPAGAFVTAIGTTGDGRLNGPRGTGLDPAGNLYVADAGNGRIAVFKPDGTFAAAIGKGVLTSPQDVAVDAAGNLYVLETSTTDIIKMANDVTPPKITLSGPRTQAGRGSVKIGVKTDENAKGKLSGSVTAAGEVVGGLISKTASFVADTAKNLAVNLSSAASKKVAPALRAGKKVRVKITVRLRDAAGNRAVARRTITIKR
jgi:DNA-binding beta-propeller fold protein YncE